MFLKIFTLPRLWIIFTAVLITMATFNLFSCLSVALSPNNTDIRNIWFDDIKFPISFAESEWEQLVSFAASSILSGKDSESSLPAAIRHDKQPRIVFISVSDGKSHCRVVMGSGMGVVDSFRQAVSKVNALPGKAYRIQWIKIDIVQEVFSMEDIDLNKPVRLERSLYGMAFNRSSGIAFIPEELVAHSLINKKQYIRRDKIAEYIEKQPTKIKEHKNLFNSDHSKTYRFSTKSFFIDGKDVVNLYRGHRFFEKVTRDELLTAAIKAGQYLTRSVDPDGKFVYIYRAKTDKVAKKYNIIRHAGTVYSMLELYEVTGDTELLKAAKRAIRYLLESVYPYPPEKGTAACVVEEGYAKLGGNALSAVALAKYMDITKDYQYMSILLELCRWIQSIQTENGEFSIHKQSYPGGEVVDFVSVYYPGEALLAMTRIHALDPEGPWLDIAEAAAHYLIKVRDGNLKDNELPHDHWLLYALNELYRQRPNPLYLNQALRIARAIMESQNRNPIYTDWRGSFYVPPRSTSTATRIEGLYSAYLLAQDFCYPEETKTILEGIWLGIRFQLQTQFRPESVLYLNDPQRCLGGFHRSLTNFDIRIDYLQHNISSLLGLYRILTSKEKNL
jgi:hypothetical protein